jgi:hypothetical protein
MSRTFTADELKQILESHSRWLRGDSDGRRANLSGAYLSGAYLSGAYLSGANLSDAYLSGAYLSGADLSGADLSDAYLSGADLSDANLSGADLSDANLSHAYLSGADLSDANLSDANLSDAKDDFFKVLDATPTEVPALLETLRSGRVDGSTYEGECACLVGTIAKARGVNPRSIPNLVPDSNRPAERLFLAIRRGDTPENHPIAKIVEDWIGEWMAKHAEVKP